MKDTGGLKEEKQGGRWRNKRKRGGGGHKRGRKKWIKKTKKKQRYSYVGYCSLTAPLLNFKREPWAEQRAEQRAAEEREERRGSERANGKLTLEANRRQAGEEGRNEIS